jgi:EAL domain-containing protein (putative c-di-GMP-specific phosphodiesterase class I)
MGRSARCPGTHTSEDLVVTAILTAPPKSPTADLEAADGATTVAGLPGHFCLHYQPQMDLHSGAILRCEALLRWWHPEFGLLSPHASLMGTRWSDDVSGLEGWAVREAIRQGALWDQQGLSVQIALNVSAPFLLRPGFVGSLLGELDASALASYLLAIDVPIEALATSSVPIERVAHALEDAGIGVVADGVLGSMDADHLAAIGAEAWKIHLGKRAAGRPGLHRSVGYAVQRAHEVGARAVAKAIQDDEQLAEARALGFDEVFGNIISPPLSGRAARDLFRFAPPRMRPLFGPGSHRADAEA